jgi:hypothetical protein
VLYTMIGDGVRVGRCEKIGERQELSDMND